MEWTSSGRQSLPIWGSFRVIWPLSTDDSPEPDLWPLTPWLLMKKTDSLTLSQRPNMSTKMLKWLSNKPIRACFIIIAASKSDYSCFKYLCWLRWKGKNDLASIFFVDYWFSQTQKSSNPAETIKSKITWFKDFMPNTGLRYL